MSQKPRTAKEANIAGWKKKRRIEYDVTALK
jgi:hypothetical protein